MSESEASRDAVRARYLAQYPYTSPRLNACASGNLADVNALITADNINQFGSSAESHGTPLMIAARYEHLQIVQSLIEKGADPTIVNDDGENVLHIAAMHNASGTGLIRLLLDNMPLDSINKEDNFGFTPLDVVRNNDDSPIHQEIIALIRSKGGISHITYDSDDISGVDSDEEDINANEPVEPDEPAILGRYYTLEEFRRPNLGFPIEANRLTFTVPGKELDCDVGDHELTRYMPVKVKTGSNWDVDGTGKLFVFCAEDLRQWVTTKVPNYERYYDTNPMTSNVISGVQYLTQEEITAEEAKYTDLKSEDKDVEENRKKLEREANEKGFAEAKKFLRDNSMLSILRKQLSSAKDLVKEEEEKFNLNMSQEEQDKWYDNVQSAKDKVKYFEQLIKREEEKAKRKNPSSDGGSNKRQKNALFLKLSNLKF